ncbi:hypothetical protein KOW79_019457 [Hemibagrus wyckioides]|uniref:Uncharacterized protein n=1 Tax=Hemibagrus wyckioides TaxID=337641 RepID=A0A9D3N9E7_9TELE|nr:hypothetical protein KOW79_019457 [Hemibagrus wyckioides]
MSATARILQWRCLVSYDIAEHPFSIDFSEGGAPFVLTDKASDLKRNERDGEDGTVMLVLQNVIPNHKIDI